MATHVRSFNNTPDTTNTAERAVDFATTKLARTVFAVPFSVFGLLHILNANAMAGMVPVPGGAFWIYFTGFALIAGSIGILTGKLGRLAAFGLAGLLLTFVVGIHIPGLANAATQQNALTHLLKDTSLIGAALTWAGLAKRS